MARVLLRWLGVNRFWLLAPLFAASGCLYIEPLNEPPNIQLVNISSNSAHKGEPISMRARTYDDGEETQALTVDFEVKAIDGQALDPCDYEKTQAGHAVTYTFYRTGMFAIAAYTADTHGSPSLEANNSTVMVTIDDAPPIFAKDATPVGPGENRCGFHTGGQVVRMHLESPTTPQPVFDFDANKHNDSVPGCGMGETLTYTWRVVSMPAMARPRLTAVVNDECPDVPGGTTLVVPTAATQVCLWTEAVSTTSKYSVVLEVSDGTTTAMTGPGDVSVNPDQPACITGTQLPSGDYVVDRSELQTFQVTGVADDLDGFGSAGLTFAWSVWRDHDVDPVSGQPVWRQVPSHPGPSYTLDVSGFAVGENVKVRVEAVDRSGMRATCNIGDADCVATSSTCATGGATCNRWRTWNLELR